MIIIIIALIKIKFAYENRDYNLYPVQTGLFKLDGGAMFGVVPKNLWQKTNPSDEQNRIEMCTRALLLDSGKRKILIDTGIGYKLADKSKQNL